MKAMKVVVNYMMNALKESEEAYHDYIIFKIEYPRVSQTALEMAQAHLNLYNKWHECMVNLINEHKEKDGEIPDMLKDFYEYENRKMTETYDELSYKIKNQL